MRVAISAGNYLQQQQQQDMAQQWCLRRAKIMSFAIVKIMNSDFKLLNRKITYFFRYFNNGIKKRVVGYKRSVDGLFLSEKL
jgi:hypothetical protein